MEVVAGLVDMGDGEEREDKVCRQVKRGGFVDRERGRRNLLLITQEVYYFYKV